MFGDVDGNIERIVQLRGGLRNVDLALTPELALNGYGLGGHAASCPLVTDDDRLRSLVTDTSVAMGIGFAEAGSGRPRNAYLLHDPVTGSRHVQHKIHPVSYAPWNEHHSFDAGDFLGTTLVRGARCATVICNDMWHPAVPWLAAKAGAEVLIVPVASIEGADPEKVQRTWQVILEHTALLLQCYVVFVNRCGTDSGARFWGGSRVLGPDGNTITELGDVEAITHATLDLAGLRALRARTPLLFESRADFVAEALARAGHLPREGGGGGHV
jgi:predicted amidohydrolase